MGRNVQARNFKADRESETIRIFLIAFLLAVWRARIIASISGCKVEDVLRTNLAKLSGETGPKTALEEAKGLP